MESQHDLTDKTVAIVGTGSTATQIVPEIAGTVRKVYLFQREPGWVVPKMEKDLGLEEQERLRNPIQYRWERLKWFAATEELQWRGAPFRPGIKVHTMGQQAALGYIGQVFADRPIFKRRLRLTIRLGKRLIRNSTFYPSLVHPNVELIPRAVLRITPTSVVDEDGVEREIDILVMGTGFQPSNYLGTMEVRGRTGQTLQDYWQGEPRGSSEYGAYISELLHDVRAWHQWRRDCVDVDASGRVHSSRRQTDEAATDHRGRGKGHVGRHVARVVAVQGEHHRLCERQQLLQRAKRQHRHAVAVQPWYLRRSCQGTWPANRWSGAAKTPPPAARQHTVMKIRRQTNACCKPCRPSRHFPMTEGA